MPFGSGWAAYENAQPHAEPSPSSSWNNGSWSGVEMMRISLIRACRRVLIG